MKKYFIIIGVVIVSFTFLYSQESLLSITNGPYLQGLTENEVSIIWTTNKNSTAWVELAPDDDTHFYVNERPKNFEESNGFKTVDTVHRVTISNLKPNTTYRYRIYSQEVISHIGTKVLYGTIAATDVYRTAPLTFTTNNPLKKDISFLVLNDIHGDNNLLENLLKETEWDKTDLVFFNGDMTNDIRSESQLFGDFLDKAIEIFAKKTPFYYSRGNHETRGNFATTFPRYFPTPSGQLYYIFRQGPVCFIVLDCGEDKPDSDIEYGGIVAFDNYRSKQAQWLEKVIDDSVFKEAPYRVVIIHMPPFGGWHGEKEIKEKFVPVLEKAGIDIMLCGHLHSHVYKKSGEGQNFPIIVNSTRAIIKAHTENNRLFINVVDESGKLVESVNIPSRK